jgi:hypothetical protein
MRRHSREHSTDWKFRKEERKVLILNIILGLILFIVPIITSVAVTVLLVKLRG